MAFGRLRGIYDKIRGRDADANGFIDVPGYRAVWSEKQLPSPGAMNYAYESLGLSPTSPISSAVANRNQLAVVTAGNLYQPVQALQVQGIPLVSGQVYGQPLFDPNGNYGGPAPFRGSPLISINDPIAHVTPIPTNAPFPNAQKTM